MSWCPDDSAGSAVAAPAAAAGELVTSLQDTSDTYDIFMGSYRYLYRWLVYAYGVVGTYGPAKKYDIYRIRSQELPCRAFF